MAFLDSLAFQAFQAFLVTQGRVFQAFQEPQGSLAYRAFQAFLGSAVPRDLAASQASAEYLASVVSQVSVEFLALAASLGLAVFQAIQEQEPQVSQVSLEFQDFLGSVVSQAYLVLVASQDFLVSQASVDSQASVGCQGLAAHQDFLVLALQALVGFPVLVVFLAPANQGLVA